MATYTSSTFGVISGKHGTAVAAKTKKGCILKVFNAPSNPKTPKQMVVRNRFGFVATELTSMREMFKKTFKSNDGKKRAMSLANPTAIKGESPNLTLDYSLLQISEGAVYETNSVTAVKTTGTSLQIEWDATELSGALLDDQVSLAFYNPEMKQTLLKENVAQRQTKQIEVELPAIWEGSSIHCWIYFSSAKGLENSKSQYIALVEV